MQGIYERKQASSVQASYNQEAGREEKSIKMRWKKALRVKNVCSDTKYLEKNEDLEEFRSVAYLMSLVLDFFFYTSTDRNCKK